jgi:ATP-binding cassette, subfamily B, multidrug efflux pump
LSRLSDIFRTALPRRVLSYTLRYKRLFYAAVALTLVLSCVAIVRPLLINQALNRFVKPRGDTAGLNFYCTLILGTLLVEALLQVTNTRIANRLGQNVVRDLRNQVYRHIMRLRNAWFDQTPVGTIVTRSISDIESLNDMFSQGFIVIAGDLVMLAVFIAAMFAKQWVLALLALSTIPLLFVATALFKRGVKATFTLVRNAVSDLNTFTQEHITGMKVVQLFNKEKEEYEKFKAINEKHRRANIKSIFYYSVFFPVVDILSSVSIALVIWCAGMRSGALTVGLGDITFFIMMVNMMFRPIRMLADRLNTLQMGIVSAERVFKVLDTDEVITAQGACAFTGVKDSIVFRNVWFAYRGEDFVLKNVSFTISKGSDCACWQHRRGKIYGNQPSEPLLRVQQRRDTDRRDRHPRV